MENLRCDQRYTDKIEAVSGVLSNTLETSCKAFMESALNKLWSKTELKEETHAQPRGGEKSFSTKDWSCGWPPRLICRRSGNRLHGREDDRTEWRWTYTRKTRYHTYAEDLTVAKPISARGLWRNWTSPSGAKTSWQHMKLGGNRFH